MKGTDGYRFNIHFTSESDAEIRAGEYLKSLGRRKSTTIVAAVNEYLNNHPELSDSRHRRITISTFTQEQLEAVIVSVLEKGNYTVGTPVTEKHSESVHIVSDKESVTQDVMDMLNDLELFNI